MPQENLTLDEIRNKARQKLKGHCGVYKQCDGAPNRLCQGNDYGKPIGIGGVGTGKSFHNNFLALQAIQLHMNLLEDHIIPDTKYDFFGTELDYPIMAASVAGVNSFGGEAVITEQDFCDAVVQGCRAAGTLAWRGDTYNYSLEETYGIDAIAGAGGWGVKIIKPREQDVIKQFIEKAEKAGAKAVGVDVDGCGSYAMAKHNKPTFKKSVQDLQALKEFTSLPFIVKGVMTAEDAQKAVDAGADALVVSNHGGRVLDHTPGTATVLPVIAKAVQGKIRIIVDGGIRTGYDVLKMLALGAESVLIGRDQIRAAVGGGAQGVAIQMEYLAQTFRKALLMTGCGIWRILGLRSFSSRLGVIDSLCFFSSLG
jgi:4-hydroxymandelate oxidase